MTPFFNPANPRPPSGLFQQGNHILVLPAGSALAILDLERGLVYATTPLGAESWDALVSEARPPRKGMPEGARKPEDDEDAHAWAQIAGFLLDRRVIELVPR